MMRPTRGIILILLGAGCVVAGCSAYSHVNLPLSPGGRRATFELRDPRGAPDVLVLLALSGGGSRAAVFAGAVMLELDEEDDAGLPRVDLLQEVDAISSVSGGSLSAAYYALSKDRDEHVSTYVDSLPLGNPPPAGEYDPSSGHLAITGSPTAEEVRRVRGLYYGDLPTVDRLLETARRNSQAKLAWDRRAVRDAMDKDYQTRWLLKYLNPWTLGKLTFTTYDRADMMAEVFDKALKNAAFSDLNPERPYLFINATDATSAQGREHDLFRRFVFTEETASEATKSEISSLPMGRAVMASAAFPGAFAYVTLKNYNKEGRYVHLFDGGNHDNVGLETLKEIIVRNQDKYDAIAVISIDADVSLGEPEDAPGGAECVPQVRSGHRFADVAGSFPCRKRWWLEGGDLSHRC